jgi:SsrA-binding protein
MKHLKPDVTYSYKKLNFLYNEIDSFIAGIILTGWEAKSLDNHNGDINGSYAKFAGNQLKLINSSIIPLLSHGVLGKVPNVDRILLLNKSELKKIKEYLEIKGHTCIPVYLYRNERFLWKVKISIVKPLKNYDKREKIKQRDLSRTI